MKSVRLLNRAGETVGMVVVSGGSVTYSGAGDALSVIPIGANPQDEDAWIQELCDHLRTPYLVPVEGDS